MAFIEALPALAATFALAVGGPAKTNPEYTPPQFPGSTECTLVTSGPPTVVFECIGSGSRLAITREPGVVVVDESAIGQNVPEQTARYPLHITPLPLSSSWPTRVGSFCAATAYVGRTETKASEICFTPPVITSSDPRSAL